jgi:hypothetical protein
MSTITAFDDSVIQIRSDSLRLKNYSSSDYERRKSAPWVYFEPNEITSPAFPPPYIPVSITADNVVTLCGNGVTLNAEYILTPVDYNGLVDLFWEQQTGSGVTIDNPTLKNPTISYNSSSTFDFVMRVYIDKGTNREMFADATVIRTPVGTSLMGSAPIPKNLKGKVITRSGAVVKTLNGTSVVGSAPTKNNQRYLSDTRSNPILRENFNIGKFSQMPSTADQSGNSLPTYNIEDIQFTQINWTIPNNGFYNKFKFHAIEIYKNEILIETYYSRVQSYVAPIGEDIYSVAILYINSDNGKILTIHKDEYAVANIYNKVGSGYLVDVLAQGITLLGFQPTISTISPVIVRSGVAVKTASSTTLAGATMSNRTGEYTITRINGISIGN